MQKVIFVAGPQYSKKTYFIETTKHFDKNQYTILDINDYISDSSYYHDYDELLKYDDMLFNDFIVRLNEGKSIIVEHPLIRIQDRVRYIEEARKIKNIVIGIYVSSLPSVRYIRNFDYSNPVIVENVEKQSMNFEYPIIEDGFDHIYGIDGEALYYDKEYIMDWTNPVHIKKIE